MRSLAGLLIGAWVAVAAPPVAYACSCKCEVRRKEGASLQDKKPGADQTACFHLEFCSKRKGRECTTWDEIPHSTVCPPAVKSVRGITPQDERLIPYPPEDKQQCFHLMRCPHLNGCAPSDKWEPMENSTVCPPRGITVRRFPSPPTTGASSSFVERHYSLLASTPSRHAASGWLQLLQAPNNAPVTEPPGSGAVLEQPGKDPVYLYDGDDGQPGERGRGGWDGLDALASSLHEQADALVNVPALTALGGGPPVTSRPGDLSFVRLQQALISRRNEGPLAFAVSARPFRWARVVRQRQALSPSNLGRPRKPEEGDTPDSGASGLEALAKSAEGAVEFADQAWGMGSGVWDSLELSAALRDRVPKPDGGASSRGAWALTADLASFDLASWDGAPGAETRKFTACIEKELRTKDDPSPGGAQPQPVPNGQAKGTETKKPLWSDRNVSEAIKRCAEEAGAKFVAGAGLAGLHQSGDSGWQAWGTGEYRPFRALAMTLFGGATGGPVIDFGWRARGDKVRAMFGSRVTLSMPSSLLGGFATASLVGDAVFTGKEHLLDRAEADGMRRLYARYGAALSVETFANVALSLGVRVAHFDTGKADFLPSAAVGWTESARNDKMPARAKVNAMSFTEVERECTKWKEWSPPASCPWSTSDEVCSRASRQVEELCRDARTRVYEDSESGRSLLQYLKALKRRSERLERELKERSRGPSAGTPK